MLGHQLKKTMDERCRGISVEKRGNANFDKERKKRTKCFSKYYWGVGNGGQRVTAAVLAQATGDTGLWRSAYGCVCPGSPSTLRPRILPACCAAPQPFARTCNVVMVTLCSVCQSVQVDTQGFNQGQTLRKTCMFHFTKDIMSTLLWNNVFLIEI